MRIRKIILGKYFKNCFWLFIPIFAWDILFINKLPIGYSTEFFDKNIPLYISYSENILRIILFSSPAFMIFSLKLKTQKIGLALYVIGIVVYFISWLLQICLPNSMWSKSIYGYTALAYTTIFYFLGIGLIGRQTFFTKKTVSKIYIFLSICFVIIHFIHTYIGFGNYGR